MCGCVYFCVQISNTFTICLFVTQPLGAGEILPSFEDGLLFSHATKIQIKRVLTYFMPRSQFVAGDPYGEGISRFYNFSTVRFQSFFARDLPSERLG